MKIGTVEVLACVGATNELFVRLFTFIILFVWKLI